MKHAQLILIFAFILTLGITPVAADEALEALVGDWEMTTDFQGQQIPATMTLTLKEGKLSGLWKSEGGEMEMKEIVFSSGTLTFNRTMGEGGENLSFKGTVEGDTISGEWDTPMGSGFTCKGKKAGAREGS